MNRMVKRAFLSGLPLVLVLALLTNAGAQTLKDDSLKGMKWRLVGPFRGGRVLAVTGVPGDANTFYFGGVSGGVWKTTDGGLSWLPVSDKQMISSIGALAVAPSNPNILYAGTGEACIRGNISYGDGVYKSTDAGKTWTNVGLKDTRQIARIAVDPRNPDVVLVAALGHAFGANAERGIFRSADGGKTWTKTLFVDDKTGASDVSIDPANPSVVFAGMWQAVRSPWSLSSGGPGSGLYRSADGGATWKKLEGHGLPKGVMGRIGVAVSAQSNRIFALIEAEDGGLFRSDDGGDSWQKMNDERRFRQRAWYFTHVFADPKNPNVVYILNTGMFRSIDGGQKFSFIAAPHGDDHGLWIDPTDPDRMINGNDGGATITQNGGKAWTTQANQPTAQFYHVATDNQFLYRLYGAQQDNSTVSIASRSDNGLIDRTDWYPVAGGESGWVVPAPGDPEIVYADSYDGLISRYDVRIHQGQDISPWPLNPMGHGAAELKHRFQWTAPIAVSPHDPKAVYFGAEVLFKTTDGGMNWTAISPDLTRNDKSKQQSSGGPITQDNTSVEYYDTIFTIAESPVAADELWIGTDDGYVQLTRDGGKTWANVTPKNMPEWSLVSIVEPSPHDAATAYIAVERHKLDDIRPYIYRTDDYGKSWKKITDGIPDGAYVHAVREDVQRKGLLFAGTETGVYVSFDDGGRWQSLQLNLPNAPVHDLVVHGNDLAVATHGRSFWVLDDMTPLRQWNDQTASADVFLYPPAATYRYNAGGFTPPPSFAAGENPPAGAVIDYFLKTENKDEMTLEILDEQGKLVRKYSTKKPVPPEESTEYQVFDSGEKLPGEACLNRFVWDLNYDPPVRVKGEVNWGDMRSGPEVLAGKFTVRLTVAGKSYTAPLEILPDPRIKASREDLQKQLDLALRIRDTVSDAQQAVLDLRSLRSQMDAMRRRLASDPKAKEVTAALEETSKKLTAVEEALVQTKSKSFEDPLNFPIRAINQMMDLYFAVESADTAPTKSSYEVFDLLNGEIETQLANWHDLRDKDVPALNQKLRDLNIPFLNLPQGKAPAGAAK